MPPGQSIQVLHLQFSGFQERRILSVCYRVRLHKISKYGGSHDPYQDEGEGSLALTFLTEETSLISSGCVLAIGKKR